MRRLRNVLLISMIGALGAVLAPQAGGASPEPERLAPAEAADAQAALLEWPKIDLSVVYVIRLTVDGRPVEVTSLAPTLVSNDLNGTHWAASVFAYTADKSALVLFSRDPASGAGYRLTLPVAELTEGHEFRFPVLSNGSLADVPITVAKHVHKP